MLHHGSVWWVQCKYQPNIVLDCEVHFSLHSSFHHQMAFVKFDLKVCYPPPYERRVWHYKYANIAQIKIHLHLSTGNKHLLVALSIRRFLFLMKQLSMLWVIIFPMKQRYLMTRICHGWVRKLRSELPQKMRFFKKDLKNNRNCYYTEKYKVLQRKLENLIESSKQSYYKRE